MTLLKDRRITYLATLIGFLNALGNLSIIFAIKFARDAGSSSSSINTILMLNVLIALMAGVFMFGERHTLMQYIGGILVIGAILLITFERQIAEKGKISQHHSDLHFGAVFFTVFT